MKRGQKSISAHEKGLTWSLFVLFAIFSASAFIKCDFCWGINYLYYFPGWIKILFVFLGGICFIPETNSVFHSGFSNIARNIAAIYNFAEKKFIYRVFLYLVSIAVSAFVFYYFRIFSLYHAPMGAVYFMERNIPIWDYYKNWILVEDKYSLLLLWATARYLFKQVLNFTNYQSLAVTSVVFGVFFMIILQYFISKFKEYSSFEKLLIFLLIFTQGITYYYFGFANYYAPVPVVIFAYVVAVILYFRGEAGIYLPLFLGIFAVIVHLGAVFILPSMVFIVLHRFKSSLDFLYGLATFRNFRKSLYVLISVILLGYVLIAIGMPYSPALSEYFVPPFAVTERYGFPLLSMQYVIHLVNMLLLSSPVGIVLFAVYSRRIHTSEIIKDGKYALLWIAIAGVLHQVFLLPQTIFAWDVYAWTSIGFVVVGIFLFIHYLRNTRKYGYYATIVAAHCSIYFVSWILLNSNPYASVLNYLDTAENYDPQFMWCLQILNEDFRDDRRIDELMRAVEDRIENAEECLAASFIYNKLKDQRGTRKFHDLYMKILSKQISQEPNNANNYYKMIRGINILDEDDRRQWAERLGPLHDKLIDLEPNNTFYLGIVGRYYMGEDRYEDALKIFQRMDSLYNAEEQSLFITKDSHYEVKISLCYVSYYLSEYPNCIQYFNEAILLGLNKHHNNYADCITLCLLSYGQLGNVKKYNQMIAECEKESIESNVAFGTVTDRDILINRVTTSHLMLQKLDGRRWREFHELFKYANEDSIYLEYNHLNSAYLLMEREHQTMLQWSKDNTEDSIYNEVIRILCLIGIKQYNEALSLIDRLDDRAGSMLWLKSYIYFINNQFDEMNSWITANLSKTSNHIKANPGLKLILLLAGMENQGSDAENSVGHFYVLPGAERVLSIRNIPDTLRFDIQKLMDEINSMLLEIILFNNFEGSPTDKGIHAIAQELNDHILHNRCLEFLKYLKENYHFREQIYRRIPEDRITVYAERDIFTYAQELRVRQERDSLEIITQGMIDVFPSLFEGYFLKGVYYKGINAFVEAKKYFAKASSLLDSSFVFRDNEAVKKRVRQIVAGVPQ